MRHLLITTLFGGIGFLALQGTGYAASANSCVPEGTVVRVSADPSDLNQLSGGKLASQIRNNVASDPHFLDKLSGLVDTLGPTHYGSIGAGLGEAANLCAKIKPEVAAAIQQAVLQLNKKDITDAFQGVTGDLQTTSVGEGPTVSTPPGADGNIGQGPNPTRRDDTTPLAGGVVPNSYNPFAVVPNVVSLDSPSSNSGSSNTTVISTVALGSVSVSR